MRPVLGEVHVSEGGNPDAGSRKGPEASLCGCCVSPVALWKDSRPRARTCSATGDAPPAWLLSPSLLEHRSKAGQVFLRDSLPTQSPGVC